MRKTRKTITTALLAAMLAASACLTSFGFYQEPESKKGILVSGQEPELLQDIVNLGCKQAICNLASYQNVNSFDPLAQTCRSNGITLTMILLNNFGGNPDLLPVSGPVEGTGNYAFNVSTAAGEAAVRAYARNVAGHYSNTVSNWVIGNEVNDAVTWDYSGVTDMDEHAAQYAKAFRIFYEEIKKANSEARVFIPFDMRWNAQYTDGSARYTVKEYLPKLNEHLKDLDYGIAWHAYPVHFFTKPEFLDDDGISFDLDTPNINLKNMDVLTSYLQTPEMLSPSGQVRHLILTEQGFTSACENGEARQAEAIRQAYDIVKANPYIEGFYLSRQVDAQSQESAGGAFGLWTRNPNASRDETPQSKKQAWSLYQSLN